MFKKLITAAFVGVIAGPVVALAGPAHARGGEPEGGCQEAWQAPRSADANWCRDRGWFIRRYTVIFRHREFHLDPALPECESDDVSTGPVPCRLNYGPTDHGDGDAPSFIVSGSNAHPWFHRIDNPR